MRIGIRSLHIPLSRSLTPLPLLRSSVCLAPYSLPPPLFHYHYRNMAAVPSTSSTPSVASTSTSSVSTGTTETATAAGTVTRGAFILFEGLDRTGKTTQSLGLAQRINAVHQRFPGTLYFIDNLMVNVIYCNHFLFVRSYNSNWEDVGWLFA
jgi:hypothetical protein